MTKLIIASLAVFVVIGAGSPDTAFAQKSQKCEAACTKKCSARLPAGRYKCMGECTNRCGRK